MGCNCKNKKSLDYSINTVESSENSEPLFDVIVKYAAKIIGFLVAVCLMPLIMLVIIWFMFDVIVLTKEIDLTKILDKFVNKAKYFNEEDDEDDDDDYADIDTVSEDKLIMLNAEEIIKSN
jgi:hypothetical protein